MKYPDPIHLNCFLIAAERLDVHIAARQFGLEPQVFLDHIDRLEDSLAVPLFQRRRHRLRLTPEGERLLPQARRALRESERCLEVVVQEHDPQPFALTIGTRYELGMSWLVPSLDELGASRPERQLHMSFGDSSDLLQRLDRGRIDALISSVRLTRSDLEYETLHAEEYAFVASPELLARSPMTSAATARDHNLIDISSSLPLFHYLRDALQDAEPWPFKRVEYLGTIGAICYRVLRGAGVAVLPLYFIREHLAAGRLKALLPWLSLRQDAFRLVWRSEDLQDAEFRQLGRELKRIPLR